MERLAVANMKNITDPLLECKIAVVWTVIAKIWTH